VQPGDLEGYGGGVADRVGERDGLAVDQLECEAVDGWAGGRQIAELTAPDLRWGVANPGDVPEHELADGSRRRNTGRSGPNEIA